MTDLSPFLRMNAVDGFTIEQKQDVARILRENGFTEETQLEGVNDDQVKRMFPGKMALEVLAMRYIHGLTPPKSASKGGDGGSIRNYSAKFLATLKNAAVIPDEKVIKRVVADFSPNLMTSAFHPYLAIALYNSVAILPGTTTRSVLQKELGIYVSGTLGNKPSVILTATDHRKPIILKIDAAGYESENYRKIFYNLHGKNVPPNKTDLAYNHLVHCDLINIKVDHQLAAGLSNNPTLSTREFSALKMERYVGVLGRLPEVVDQADLLIGANMIEKALNFLHSAGFVHMDVKGDNIFVDANGSWFVGDYGACVQVGEAVKEYTVEFYPTDLTGKLARADIDWYMLVVTLAMQMIRDDDEGIMKLMNDDKRVDDLKLKTFIQNAVSNEALRDFMWKYTLPLV